MEALCWSDYLCPWCYVGTDRTALLRSLGVRVTVLPFELHPEVPVGGAALPRPPRWVAIAAEAEDVRLPFDPPDRLPNTRRVLEVSEWVRRVAGDDAHAAFSDAVFRAHFAERRRIDDEGELASFVADAGLSIDDALSALAGGEPQRWVDESMALARDLGVAGTPAWVLAGSSGGGGSGSGGGVDGGVDGGLLIPGVQPRSFFERVVAKLQSRAAASDN